jgi:hypothetical protein
MKVNKNLTPRNRVLLGKLTVIQLVKKFPAFYITQKVHHCVHISQSTGLYLGAYESSPHQCLFKIQFNIVLPHMSRALKEFDSGTT